MEYKWSKTGVFICGLHTNSTAEAAGKAKSRKLAKGRACSVLQHGWFKRKADTNREAKLENLSFSKLIRNVERLLNLLVFQVEALQSLVGFFK